MAHVVMNSPFTVSEFAKLAKVHPETVRAWCRSGILKARKFGKKERGQWRIFDDPTKF